MLELLQPRSGLEPQLFDENGTCGGVGTQRVGLAARAVQRQHELLVEALPQGKAFDELAQLADNLSVAPDGEEHVGARFDRSPP